MSSSLVTESLDGDMSEEEYNIKKNSFKNNLSNEAKTRLDIVRETIERNHRWLDLRGRRLTSSMFAEVCKRRVKNNSASLVDRLLYPDIRRKSFIIAASQSLDRYFTQLQHELNITIEKCGIFIDENLHFLAATPQGLYESGIVKIFCPPSACGMSPEEAITQKKIKFWNENGSVNINDDHFYHIQGKLHITQKNKCIFAVWTGEEFNMKVQEIERDDMFWRNNMEKKLTDFYENCYLPELVDPRKKRGKPIRDIPNWHCSGDNTET